MTPRDCAERIAVNLRTVYPNRNWPGIDKDLNGWATEVGMLLPKQGAWTPKFTRALDSLKEYNNTGNKMLRFRIISELRR